MQQKCETEEADAQTWSREELQLLSEYTVRGPLFDFVGILRKQLDLIFLLLPRQ